MVLWRDFLKSYGTKISVLVEGQEKPEEIEVKQVDIIENVPHLVVEKGGKLRFFNTDKVIEFTVPKPKVKKRTTRKPKPLPGSK